MSLRKTPLPVVLALAGFGFGSFALPNAQGAAWVTNGPMATTRSLHTATLLPNGKVLVVGGYNTNGSLALGELYDPATGKWTATAALTVARHDHTATLLANGKVLVAGGFYAGNSAELYDPATGTWSPTGATTDARGAHTATLLANGKVLVAGGATSGGNAISTAELYDPATGTWTLTGPSHPGGISVTDCLAAPCTGLDTDPATGDHPVTVTPADLFAGYPRWHPTDDRILFASWDLP